MFHFRVCEKSEFSKKYQYFKEDTILSTKMQFLTVAILMMLLFGGAQSQTWTGTFTADSQCSTSICCCLSGKVTLLNSTSSSYTVGSSLSGVCGGLTLFAGTAYVSGYSGWIMFGSTNDTLVLSSDSNTITLTNPTTSACSGSATRSSAIKDHVNNSVLLATALIGLIMNLLIV